MKKSICTRSTAIPILMSIPKPISTGRKCLRIIPTPAIFAKTWWVLPEHRWAILKVCSISWPTMIVSVTAIPATANGTVPPITTGLLCSFPSASNMPKPTPKNTPSLRAPTPWPVYGIRQTAMPKPGNMIPSSVIWPFLTTTPSVSLPKYRTPPSTSSAVTWTMPSARSSCP